ncbi:MAG: RsmD family RNA methyltransferase [Candidatus Caldarchaeum sp.]
MLKPRKLRLLAGWEARRVIGLRSSATEASVSLDLGLSTTLCKLTSEALVMKDVSVGWNELERMADTPEDVYVLGGRVRRLGWFDQRYYRLVLPKWGHAPTVEIDGIRMHRTVDVPPEADAAQKVQLFASLRNKSVLDVCTGLGYTSTALLKRGVARVMTVEKDFNVLRMASYNPWSRALFSDERVDVVNADAFDFLSRCNETFDCVVHDPPTIRMVGELYSLEFYCMVASVLKKGGCLVHYVGQPGFTRGQRVYVGVMERLRRAGFRPQYVDKVRCVRAVKV